MYLVLDVKLHCLILLVPLIGINMIRNLKVLAPFSSLANVITFVGIGMILYYVCQDLPSISEREAVADLGKFPLFFGTTLFALEAVGVVSWLRVVGGVEMGLIMRFLIVDYRVGE